MSTPTFQCQAQPEFLADQSDANRSVYAFAYTITVRNTGRVAAQLIARHWIITDATGHTEEVKGLGVVGQQPLLKPGESFQYTSGTRMRTPSGLMRGSFLVVSEDGERADVEVPAFVLEATGGGAPGRVLH
ncbi:MAG: Co2+/Mg2+ efflux protein ApaG [Burkholderiaceae bacterium]|nr:Co2+/Mg2+ efflux protein ApaG [Burkholderiaceae bacterium]MDP3132421.1 Co2+/Mg2+ efflux protein ApaG [Burkholderiaceae bacterium]MDP3424015.1 Co2+/Mg2+ efflux protein ApaG [Burkholderiaceae bacterium]MDZ4160387.1 Co2+/Mg2+ efflux protein ApaG [Burkholderiales bacterium]